MHRKTSWWGTLAVLLIAASSTHAQPQLADFTTLVAVTDGIPATDDSGWANVEINATAFKNQSTLTVGDYQFISYYAADQQLILGRRNLITSPDTWYLLRTGETSANINDSHNVSTIGIDGDGYLHVAWGVHNNSLRYTRSEQPVLNDAPFTVPGRIENVIPEQNASITYPEFWSVPDSGDLLLTYRTGGSGNGEYQLARWLDGTDTWGPVHVRVNSPSSQFGPQPWIDNDFLSTQPPPNANAYHNGLAYDSSGRLHVTWTWRTGGDSTSGFTDYQSNHNLMYAWSNNHGADWFLDDGTPLQRNGQHDIDESNATPVLSIPEGSSLINQASSAVGPDDTLYVATWWAPEAAVGNHVRQYMLVEYDGATWKTHQVTSRSPEASGIGTNRVPENQLGTVRMSRPIVLTDEENRVLLVYSDYQRGQGVTVAYSESDSRDDWQFLDLTTGENLRLWEPKYDVNRWKEDGVLSMLYQVAGQGSAPTPVSVLEWDARSFFANSGVAKLTLRVNRQTGEVQIVNAAGEAIEMDHYSITSSGAQLNVEQWNSLHAQGLAGWSVTHSSATHLGEENATGSLILGDNGDVTLGAAFAGSAVAFGVDAQEDLAFHYAHDGSPQIIGHVEYVGPSLNNLTLLVDPSSGRSVLKNTSPFAAAIDAYSIGSESGALLFDDENWLSLDDQDADDGDWVEANVNAHRVTEFKIEGATQLDPDTVFELGTMFDTAGQQDLQFTFLLAGDPQVRQGIVLYASLMDDVDLAGDYNDDGVVNAADYVVWRNTNGQAITLPNDTTPGSVEMADYEVWRANFGATAAASAQGTPVPEPAGLLPILLLPLTALLGRQVRRPRPQQRCR